MHSKIFVSNNKLKFIILYKYLNFKKYGADDNISTFSHSRLQGTANFSVSNTVDYYIQLGMPRDKIMMGLNLGSYSFTLLFWNKHKIGSPSIEDGEAGKVFIFKDINHFKYMLFLGIIYFDLFKVFKFSRIFNLL